MFLFKPNSRIQETTEGIRFYEQDVLCSEYSFSGDKKIEIKLDYVTPGFGIVIAEDLNTDILKANNTYLYKLGDGELRLFRRHFKMQEQLDVSTCALSPGDAGRNITLLFELDGTTLSISKKNGSDYISVGKTTIPNAFSKYRIGIYSNAGNTVKSVTFLSKVPRHWKVSTKNTMGGRIFFTRDSLHIENCEQEAEVEQSGINLAAGTYYVQYEKEDVNGMNDAKCYVFKQKNAVENKESNLEDSQKNILKADGSFVLTEPTTVILKIKARNAVINNLFLANGAHKSFVETKDEPYAEGESKLIVNLEHAVKITWTADINDIPSWEDMSKPCPYAIACSTSTICSKEMAGIDQYGTYFFSFKKDTSLLTIRRYDINGPITSTIRINMTEADNNRITIMKNVSAKITELLLYNADGTYVNPIVRKTYKQYVPATTTSPIIVADTDTNEVFDLSSSYREVVKSRKRLILFKAHDNIELPADVPVNGIAVTLYGIPAGAAVNESETTIDKMAKDYATIPTGTYERDKQAIKLDEDIRILYAYVVVEYTDISDYEYVFTNYEREYFDGASIVMRFEKKAELRDEDVIVYGIPQNADVHDNLFYRVPEESMINSIDYYADDYDVVPQNMLTIDVNTNEIMLNEMLAGKYKQYIVDYLKSNSYSVNYANEQRRYDVDIATENDRVSMHYDMSDDGSVYDYKPIDIKADRDKYIVLKIKE